MRSAIAKPWVLYHRLLWHSLNCLTPSRKKLKRTSNAPAAKILMEHGARACTDVTGFGLVGHLLEMCRASEVFVAVDINAVPLYEGALDCLGMGITSSLQPANTRL